jgi:ATP-binding cassette subfamily B protein
MIKALRFVLGRKQGVFIWIMLWGFANSALFAGLNPLALKYLFDEGVVNKNFNQFILIGVVSLIAFTILRFSDLFSNLFTQKFKNTLIKDTSSRMLRHYQELDYIDILKNREGYFVSRIYDEPKNSVEPMFETTVNNAKALAAVLSSGAVVLFLSWQLTGLLAIVTLILFAISSRFGRKIQRFSSEEQEQEGKLKTALTSIVQAYKTINSFGYQALSQRTFLNRLNYYQTNVFARFRESQVYMTFSSVFLSWAEYGVILGGGYAVFTGTMTFGGFLAFMNAYWIAVGGLREIISSAPKVSQFIAMTGRMGSFTQSAEHHSTPIRSLHGQKTFELRDVSFSYSEKALFNKVNFKFSNKEKILLTGPNGSGKSTIAAIIAGFLNPNEGQLNLPSSVSAIIEPVYFPDVTLEELISDGDYEIASDLMFQLGLDSYRNSTFEQLSLGQRKKFCTVVALQKTADCYIFDEPLANLDPQSRLSVLEIIFKRTNGKTLMIIAHDMNDLEHYFDRVIDLNTLERKPIHA